MRGRPSLDVEYHAATGISPSEGARDATTDGTMCTLYEIAGDMRRSGPGMHKPPPTNARRTVHIVLRSGFRGHTVVVVVDGGEVYRRTGVTTNETISRADTVELAVEPRLIQIVVSVTPGDYAAALDLDAAAHPHLAINLVGEGTVSFEPSAQPFP